MPVSGTIYERVANAPDIPEGLPLVVLMTGFTDAGGTVASLLDYAREDLEMQPLVVFSNDALLDYRARRPVTVFEEDHLTEFRSPRLEISLAHDSLGQPFLLLGGYEPDFGWDAFADAVLRFASDWNVSNVTWLHAIAMPVPHTRTLGTTVSGTRSDLIAAHSVWKPRTQVPATLGHLLEYRFAAGETPVAGFVLLVPHYLAETDYPGATLSALDKLMTATGLVFGVDELRTADREYLSKVSEQIAGNEELGRMLQGLEERYDAYMSGLDDEGEPPSSTGRFDEGTLPSADELAAELERYLASRPGDDEKGGGASG